MFLALKEMKDAKLRFSLLTGIIFLIALVIFMLSGLASGLSEGHKKAISDWNATGMVLNENANQVVRASSLSSADVSRVSADKVAAVGLFSGAMTKENDDTKINVSVFGAESDNFITPKITSGKNYANNYDITISQNLADQNKLKVGDKVKLGNLDHALKITGIFASTTFSVEPVAYTNLATFQAMKYGELPKDESAIEVNAFVFKDSDWDHVLITQNKKEPLEKMTLATFIENLPGYTAEKLTLNMMIYVLIAIAAGIVGIFIYVLTLQKKSLFGVLKAQGVSTATISSSIVVQSVFLSLVGTVLAFGVTLLLSQFFPSAMPFHADLVTWLFSGVLLVVVATIGGLFSLPMIRKIDPVVAIGG